LKKQSSAIAAPASQSALLGLETRVGLVDHIDDALAAHDLAVAMATLERLERAADFHWFSPGLSEGQKLGEGNGRRTGVADAPAAQERRLLWERGENVNASGAENAAFLSPCAKNHGPGASL